MHVWVIEVWNLHGSRKWESTAYVSITRKWARFEMKDASRNMGGNKVRIRKYIPSA